MGSSNEHLRAIAMHNIYEAIASLEKAYDIVNDIGLESIAMDIEETQHDLDRIIHDKLKDL